MPSESGSRPTNRSRRLAVLAAAIATAGAVVLPAANGSASTSTAASSNTATATSTTQTNPPPGWARTIAGQLVPVAPGHDTTPVRPVPATHPEADWLGSTIGAHEPAASTTPVVTPNS